MSLRTTVFALTYDRQMAGTERAGLRAFRERLLAGAHGDVLEIGGGTGANLPCYGPGVRSLTITEPQPAMLRRLQRRIGEHRPSARVLRAPAEDLPFDDHGFDVAVSTLVLCGVDDQPRALRELRRVLRPGGQLLLIEHLRSRDPACARLQDRMNWLNRLVVCCDCNRPTLDSIRQAGFTVDQLEHTALPKTPKFVAPAILGAARFAPASTRLGCCPRRAVQLPPPGHGGSGQAEPRSCPGWPPHNGLFQKKLFRTTVARRPPAGTTRLGGSEDLTYRQLLH
jgi:ubiquinone/menaquinone biosynthesis C-methylase UbiE